VFRPDLVGFQYSSTLMPIPRGGFALFHLLSAVIGVGQIA
jgi:hypothetical protein